MIALIAFSPEKIFLIAPKKVLPSRPIDSALDREGGGGAILKRRRGGVVARTTHVEQPTVTGAPAPPPRQ